MVKSIFPPLHRLAGWTYIRNSPKEECVCVCGHTSYFDASLALLIYASIQFNMYVIGKPGLKAWYYKTLRAIINIFFAPPNEKRKLFVFVFLIFIYILSSFAFLFIKVN